MLFILWKTGPHRLNFVIPIVYNLLIVCKRL